MNILYIETSLNPNCGGVERVTWIISEFLKKHGINVFFAYHREDYDKIPQDHKIKYLYKWGEEELCKTLIPYIKKNKIDIIINQNKYSIGIIKVLEKIKEEKLCKIIYCLHQSPDWYKYKKEPFIKRIKILIRRIITGNDFRIVREQLSYNYADRVVTLSESFINDYIKIYKIKNKNKIKVIPNPLSFASNINEENIKNKEKIILIITRFEERQKNIKSALRIWNIINKKQKTNGWKLILAGYGEDEQMILDYAKELDLQSFEFVGKIENAQEYYKKASIFMLTSRYEGFGMTLTEALQNGCIPLAYNSYSAVNDIISNKYNGYTIPPFDEQMYAEKIVELINNDEKRIQMQKNALNSASKFSLENIGNKWLKLLNELSQNS